ncbi:inosine-uridine preferring nucleoside hydrolase-like [Styela clava]
MGTLSVPSDKKYLLIDCDPGVDDSYAIMMALAQFPKVEVVGITCANGNVGCRQVTMNAARILKLMGMLDKVPIFKGCDEPIVRNPGKLNAASFHGSDGLGDVPDAEPRADENLLKLVQEENAVNAILRLSKIHRGELQILAIGALTNIAIATKVDTDLPKRVKSIHILGGTIPGKGNFTPASEYNFYTDPEAAHIVLNNFSPHCKVQLVTAELVANHPLSADWFDELLTGDEPKRQFYREIFKKRQNEYLEGIKAGFYSGYLIWDTYSMGIVLDPTCVIGSTKVRVGVELGGNISRGSLIVDYNDIGGQQYTLNEIELIEKLDMEKYKKLMANAFPSI